MAIPARSPAGAEGTKGAVAASGSREHLEVDLVVRAIEASELPAFVRADGIGFGEDSSEMLANLGGFISEDLDRTRAAFEGDDIVGTSRNHSFELTVPGGAQIPAAGLSAVAVLPTHRRRGVLRSMMTATFDDAVQRGESVSMLTASEGGIYGRFGFGVSTFAQSLAVDVRAAEFAPPRPAGRARFVEPDELRKHAPSIYDDMRRSTPGVLSRTDGWWSDVQVDRRRKQPRFDVLWESSTGVVDGFVTYTIDAKWEPEPAHVLSICDLIGRTPDAIHALWRFLCEIDLVGTVKDSAVAIDSPLPWLLTSARAVKTTSVHDYVWTRVLDVPAALGSRTYGVDGRVAIAVHDAIYEGGAADGSFLVDGGPDGASVQRTTQRADLECDVATLSAAWLGGVRWSTLAAAGLVVERSAGALATADAMFASTPLPFPYTWF